MTYSIKLTNKNAVSQVLPTVRNGAANIDWGED